MRILVINCGSSSIKYKLFCFPQAKVAAKGLIEGIGEEGSQIEDHHQGMRILFSELHASGVIKRLSDIDAIGHRVVHGGERFRQPHLIDKEVLRKIKDNCRLAPLHNPANLEGIKAVQGLLPHINQVAVFDTAFHQTIPNYAYLYPLPLKYYRKYGIRRYGFHGTSHQYVALEAARQLKKPLAKLRLITCHLGNGCSITAIDRGKSVDTSMGFTPLEGLMMGTRCGDIDPAAVTYIMKRENLTAPQAESILNKKSGLLGVSGISNDMRLIKKAVKEGNLRAKLALDMFIYRIKKYIGAYAFVLGRPDAVCFTAGIGENNPHIISRLKRDICRILGSKVRVLVIPTDEELMIAHLTYKLVSALKPEGQSSKKEGDKR